ncbi:uncharacterized protein [Amphiura filiformis]|uniref:uncharacterized protein n=1 Tax=Amphiura filiformis TaxID=82378 RepID=UPI003B21DF14
MIREVHLFHLEWSIPILANILPSPLLQHSPDLPIPLQLENQVEQSLNERKPLLLEHSPDPLKPENQVEQSLNERKPLLLEHSPDPLQPENQVEQSLHVKESNHHPLPSVPRPQSNPERVQNSLHVKQSNHHPLPSVPRPQSNPERVQNSLNERKPLLLEHSPDPLLPENQVEQSLHVKESNHHPLPSVPASKQSRKSAEQFTCKTKQPSSSSISAPPSKQSRKSAKQTP